MRWENFILHFMLQICSIYSWKKISTEINRNIVTQMAKVIYTNVIYLWKAKTYQTIERAI